MLPTIQSATFISAIEDALACYNLPLCKARGQCYAWAVTWLESGRVLHNKSKKRNHKLYLHVLWACVTLAVSDTVNKCKLMKIALERTQEITKLVKYSPEGKMS